MIRYLYAFLIAILHADSRHSVENPAEVQRVLTLTVTYWVTRRELFNGQR